VLDGRRVPGTAARPYCPVARIQWRARRAAALLLDAPAGLLLHVLHDVPSRLAPAVPIDSLTYTEALEQQHSLARAVQGSMGEAALGGFGQRVDESFATAGTQSTANGLLARMIAHATPYFWCAPLANVLATAARTIPEYTFTKASFPTPDGYVWLEQTVPLLERLPGDFARTEMRLHGSEKDGFDPHADSYDSPFLLRAWSWHTIPAQGGVLLFGYIPAIERQAGCR